MTERAIRYLEFLLGLGMLIGFMLWILSSIVKEMKYDYVPDDCLRTEYTVKKMRELLEEKP